MILLQTVVLAASITLVFVRGSIFQPLRDHGPQWWRTFVSCSLCSGQWIGMACALVLLQPRELSLQYAVTILGAGSATAVLAFGIYQVFDTLIAVEQWKR